MITPVFKVRLVQERDVTTYSATMPHTAQEVLRKLCVEDRGDREVLAVVYLDAALHILGAEVVAVGSMSGVQVTPKELWRGAILACASAVIIGHNHPSGDPRPSDQDVAFTEACRLGGLAVGISLLDHIVVTTDDWWSMHEHDQMTAATKEFCEYVPAQRAAGRLRAAR